MTTAAQSELAVGLQLLSKGDLQNAATAFENVLKNIPTQADALHYLGLIAFQNGHSEKAINLIAASLKSRPNNPDAESNLGSVFMAAGDLGKAEKALQRAIRLNSASAVYHFNLGNVLVMQKQTQGAVAAYHTAIDLQPDYPEALSNLGTVYRDLENLGAATTCYEKALMLRPSYAEAAYNLANAYRDAGRLNDAEKTMRQAIALNPQNPKAHNSLGNILSESAQSDAALVEFQTAHSLDPTSLGMASNLLSCMQYVVGVTPEKLQKAHADWVQKFSPLFTDPPRASIKTAWTETLTVGFVSPDFGQHPCGFLSVRLFEHLDHRHIQPIIFSTRRIDREDDISRRIAAATDWRRVDALDDEDLTATIIAAKVDILIDMSGHTSGHRLGVFARKPAPIQMSWLGYVGSTGLPTMDYIIADRWHAPPGQHNSGPEQFLRLNDGYVCFDPPQDKSQVAPLPALQNGYVTFGCLNNATKLNAQVFDSTAVIMQHVANSKLILRFRGLDDSAVAAGIRNEYRTRGIDPARIDIRGYAKQPAFLATYNEIDIALDTFPYSGGLTTCEALWMGVPVVTFPGQTFAGRHATSHMSNAGLADFVACDRADFERLSVEKASDLQQLAHLRSEMRARLAASPLCDGPRFAASFSDAMRKIAAKLSAKLGNTSHEPTNLG
jgi:protein O-GlcNAc transferase